MSPSDNSIEQVRQARHEVSVECGHDPQRYLDHLHELVAEYDQRVTWYQPAPHREQRPAVDEPPALVISQ